ncbi:hypothetical protein [Kitasatospora sp. NPDC101183]|uniref:hypothetical protein n=1 Tax=Kitasatospora sp. NPDC101183 TaxID=3364100 RepID=UPI0037FFED02
MSIPTIGKTYHIKSKYNGSFFSGISFQKEPFTWVFHRASLHPEHWMIAVVAGDSLKRPVAVTGRFAGVHSIEGHGPSVRADYIPYWNDQKTSHKGGILWEVKDAGSGYVRLWSTYVAQYLTVEEPYFTDDKLDNGKDLFSLEEVGEFSAVVKLKQPSAMPATPKLKDMNEPPTWVPDEKGVLTGVTAAPYFLIKDDHGKDSAWQGKNSPYYIIEKWSRWHRVGWQTYAAHETKEYGWSTTEGVTKEKGKVISETTSFSINTHAGFSFWGVSAEIGASFGHDLNVTTTETITENYTYERHYSRSITPDHDEAISTWYPVHTYVVYRVDGETDVLDFNVTVPDEPVEVTYEDKK